jgi:LysR family transcriptional regulator, transcriptional activator of the cysJI operon
MQDFRMETFLTVCSYMNFTRAAEALNITQPAVSQHIHVLENYYGVPLFYYKGKKLYLTDAGSTLRSTATTMKHDEITLRDRLKAGKREKLIFGATRTIGDFVIPNILAQYVQESPETEIQMSIDNTKQLLKGINDGKLDFAIIEGYFHTAEFDYKIYSNERYIAVCNRSYPFTCEPKKLSDLFNERIILRESGSGTREIFERHMEERNYSLQDFNKIVEIGSIHAIKALVSAGCGITFLYEAAVKAELESGFLQRIPLADFEISHNFTFVWRKNSIFNDRYLKIFGALLNNK